MPKKIGVICAMEREFGLFAGCSENIFCALSGVGKVNAAIAAERLIYDNHPDCIISLGVAGTFTEGIEEGDFVIASKVAYHDVWCGNGNEPGQIQGLPLYFYSDPILLKCAQGALVNAKTGLICSGDQFYISREEDQRQKEMFPEVLAIDMEAAAIAQVCHIHKIPFLAIKIISDSHLHQSQEERYESFWSNLADESFKAATAIIEKISNQYE